MGVDVFNDCLFLRAHIKFEQNRKYFKVVLWLKYGKPLSRSCF